MLLQARAYQLGEEEEQLALTADATDSTAQRFMEYGALIDAQLTRLQVMCGIVCDAVAPIFPQSAAGLLHHRMG